MTREGKAATTGKYLRLGKIRARGSRREAVLAAKKTRGRADRPSPSWYLELGTRYRPYCCSALTSAGSAKTEASMGSVLIDLTVISICCPIMDMEVRVGIFSPPKSR